jgi:hypothetical protein
MEPPTIFFEQTINDEELEVEETGRAPLKFDPGFPADY